MIEQHFRIAEIEVSKSPTDEKILGIFRYEGSGSSKKGSTFILLAEITSTLYVYERLLDVLNATAEQTKHFVAGVEQDPVARFEKRIQRLNEAVANFLQGEPTPISWKRMNLFAIELSPNQICLTGIGRLMNIFLQKQADGSYRTFDLFGSLDQPADVDPHKPFASIICGDMKPGDILMAGTSNLEHLRNELRIKERLTTLPPISAALEMKHDLEQRGIPDDFMGAVIACCALDVPRTEPQKSPLSETGKSTASINKLRDSEREVTQRLAPTITPAPSTTPDRKPHALAKKFTQLVGNVGKTLLKRDRTKDAAALASLRGMNAGHGTLFSRKHRLIGILALVGLVVAAISYSSWRHTKQLTAQAAAWQVTFAQAQDNRNRAESDLVYANDQRARAELETAEKLLGQLDATAPDHKSKIDALREDIKQLRERLRKIVIAQPVTELVALNGQPDGTLAAPILAKDVAYVVDNSAKTILKIDLTSKQTKKIALPADVEPIVAGSLGKQSIVFTTTKGHFYAIDTQTDAVTTLTTQVRASSTTDLVLYGGRAYSLDGAAGQVWRAQSGSAGFGAQQSYIKASTTPLAGSVGMAIDSNVYVLKADGTIARFLSGGQEGFSLSTVDPALRAASGIWTSADGTRIAITDPANKRVLVFTKDGALKAQVTSQEFSGPRDVDGDEPNKRLLVIDGTRLLLIPMP